MATKELNKFKDTDITIEKRKDFLQNYTSEKFRIANLHTQEQIANEEIQQIKQKVKVEKISSAGSFYCVRCPECNNLIVLGNELNTGYVVCNKCYTKFNVDIG